MQELFDCIDNVALATTRDGIEGWDYTAQDLEGMRWKMAAEMSEDRIWLMGDDRMAKTKRIMQVDRR